MSLIPHRFPRSMFAMDFWSRPDRIGFGPSTLDLFDPFDELDHMMARNFMWLKKPDFTTDLIPTRPSVQEKYRITVDCHGYSADSLKVSLTDDKQKVVVIGREGNNNNDEEYTMKEFKKTYKLPHNAEAHKLVSFLASNGQLVVEVPLKFDEDRIKLNNEDNSPRIVDGGKKVEMNFTVPANIDPSKIKVTCKDRDLIIQAEDKQERSDGISQMSYYRRTTLPENTDFNSLKCLLENNRLNLNADLNSDLKANRAVTVEMKNSHQSFNHQSFTN